MVNFWTSPETAKYAQFPMMRDDEKMQLATDGETFLVAAVRTGDTQYGECWFLDIMTDSGSGFCLVLGKNDQRDELIDMIRAHIARNGEAVPASLSYYLHKQYDKPVWIIGPPRREPTISITTGEQPLGAVPQNTTASGEPLERGEVRDSYEEVPF